MNRDRRIEADETVAVEALAFLAADEERLERFLALAGIDAGAIRAAAAQPGFLVAVMEHLMQDDALLVTFARETERRPEHVAAAARRLGAGAWERDTP